MIDLDKYKKEITEFIVGSISRFQSKNGEPNSIGIYCCPCSGWITTNFNVKTKLIETEKNCPDFDYVEFDFMEIPDWENEYETENPKFKSNGLVKNHIHDLGDENIDEMIFTFLKPIITDIKEQKDFEFLLQMVDSDLVEVL